MVETRANIKQNKMAIYTVAMTGVSLAMILAVQFLNLPNILTGIAVNSIFVVVSKRVGFRSALSLGLLSPFGGMLTGHVLLPMYPVLPAIVVGNILFIFIYSLLRQNHIAARIILPATAKGTFIGVIGWAIVRQLNLGETVKWLALPILGFQTITAAIGVVLGEQLLKLIFTDENIRPDE